MEVAMSWSVLVALLLGAFGVGMGIEARSARKQIEKFLKRLPPGTPADERTT